MNGVMPSNKLITYEQDSSWPKPRIVIYHRLASLSSEVSNAKEYFYGLREMTTALAAKSSGESIV